MEVDMKLTLNLDEELTGALLDRAIAERRPVVMQAEVLLRLGLGLPVPVPPREK
jgi:hypothetical protein